MRFRPISIKLKLTLIIALASTIAVAVAWGAFILYDRGRVRNKMMKDATLTADMLDRDLRFAVLFDDRESADRALESLRSQDHIVRATVRSASGKVLAQYPPPKRVPASKAVPSRDVALFVAYQDPQASAGAKEREVALFNRDMFLDDQKIGSFQIETKFAEVNEEVAAYTKIGLWILLASLVVCFSSAAMLQRVFSAPILELAELEHHVVAKNDFSIRAPEKPLDEIGQLFQGFNHMLSHIQTQDQSLRLLNAETERANQELQALKEEADDANRLKDTFLANISHELRTPLNSVLNYSNLLSDMIAAGQPPTIDVSILFLSHINTSGKNLLSLINDLLDLSKIAAGEMKLEPEAFAIEEVLDEIEDTIRPEVAKRGNTLVRHVAADAAVMTADRMRVMQILSNLITNANKFTENQGRITVGVTSEIVEGEARLRFRIEDTGIGMTADQISRLFRPFEQADASTTRKYGGTGLGLSLSRKLSQLMRGDITVQSESGRGSVFTVVLPRGSAEVAETVEEPALPSLEWSSQRRLLVVDDDASVREMVKRVAIKEGFEVIAVVSGEDALEQVRLHRPDLISLDVILPGMSGWSVLTHLKDDPDLAAIPVVMLTMVDDRNRGFALGADDFVMKPVNRNHLARVLRKFKRDELSAHVLVVEDDPGQRDVIRKMLETDAWTISEAANGVEALLVIQKSKPAVVLLDLMMPEMDGFSFLEELRAIDELQRLPVIVLTAKDLSDEERERLKGRADRILQKGSCNREQLEDALRAILARYVVEPPEVVNA